MNRLARGAPEAPAFWTGMRKRVCVTAMATMAVALTWGAAVGLAGVAGGASASGAEQGVVHQADHGGPRWLALINYYRAAAGLLPVVSQPSWDRGIKHHLVYLERTPRRYLVGRYASAHTENPASPYYTVDGALEAGYSDLDEGGASSPVQAVDIWLAAPFHAIGMLRAQLQKVALADDPRTGYAGLDVIHGLNYLLPAATAPILYPGPGSSTNLRAFGGEDPDPTQTCGWRGRTVGLPIIALLTEPPVSGLSATLRGPRGKQSTANRRLCVVDEHTYHSSDRVYGPTGAEILQEDKAVILIPASPLAEGKYSVDIHQVGQANIAWSFRAGRSVPVT